MQIKSAPKGRENDKAVPIKEAMNNRHHLFRHCEGTKCPKQSQYILVIIILAIIIKLSLFVFAAIHAPQGKILPDSPTYLRLADTLASKGAFAVQNENGTLIFETFRTPGYPMFLAIFHGLMKIPLDGIILLQIAMTILVTFIVYRTALIIAPKIAFLSAAIILFDPPVTIFSMLILTETLFLLLISVFALYFTLYFKSRKLGYLILSAFMLTVAVYVRPIGYYLGFAAALFIIYVNGNKYFRKYMIHALIFVIVIYSLLGAWQVRNYLFSGNIAFSSIEKSNLSCMGLFKSYARNTDPYTKGMAPLPYYVNVSFRCLMSLMTRPGNFKYFRSELLNIGSFIFSYPWMVFWLSGFVWGIIKMGKNIYLQLMLLIILYFTAASIGGVMWFVGERFRVPIMPFIAIISAYGWINLINNFVITRREARI